MELGPKKEIVIIGNGMVGFHFCRQMTQFDTSGQFHITVFGEEAWVAYDRVHLSEHFYGKEFQDLVLADASWYSARGIDLHTKDSITSIDPTHKRVTSQSGRCVTYDELVFATGSLAFVPPIEGLKELPNVLVYRTLSDLVKIRLAAGQSKNVAVLGGGLLGLEAARACQKLGLEAHVLEMASHLMPRQLDQGAAEMLAQKIADMGIHLHCNRHTSKVGMEDNKIVVQFKEGAPLVVDMIVVAAGIKPRDEVARMAGVDCNPRGGINIDNHLGTSLPNIYAIGECAYHEGKVYGLVAPGYKMSEELAKRLLGQGGEFKGMDLSTRLKLIGTDVVSLGQPFQPSDHVTFKNEDHYRRLSILNGKLIGLVAIGPWDDLPELQKRIDGGEQIDSKELKSFLKTGSLLPSNAGQRGVLHWPDSTIICNCMNISKGQIVAACQSGCCSIQDISNCTSAGTVCGTCHPQIAQFLGLEADFKTQDLGTRWIGISTFVSALVLLFFLILPRVPFSQSVQDSLYAFEIIWRDSFWKQVSGFSCLALLCGSLLLSLRKRWNRFSWGNFQLWRASHIGLIALLYLGLYLHTGWRWGNHINLALMISFTMTALTGIATGWAVWKESDISSKARQWRASLLWIHIASFWPLPTLLGFHVFKFYYY